MQVPAYASAPSVEAHCPGGPNPDYRLATSAFGVTNHGARAYIAWGNPAVCALDNGTGFTGEWVNACDWHCLLGRDGWIEAGWHKRTGWSSPKGFCELAASQGGTGYGSPPVNVEFSLASQTHLYSTRTAGDSWWCDVAGQTRASRTTAWFGFSFADYVIAGGETMSPHSTIGAMAPASLLLSNIRRLTGSSWYVVNFPCCDAPDWPYGLDEPATGQLRNWTVPH
jgi:hypothetical protein